VKQTQADRILAALREGGWICSLRFVNEYPRILRTGARIWDLKDRGFGIESRICEHGVGEYRLVFDIERQPVQAALAI
jgi:hypothetical protein